MSATANQINKPLIIGSDLERIHTFILGTVFISQKEMNIVFPDMSSGDISKATTRLRELGLAVAKKVVRDRAKWYRGIPQSVFLDPPQSLDDVETVLEKQMADFNDEANRRNIDPPDVRNMPQGFTPSLIKEVSKPLTGKPLNPAMVLKKPDLVITPSPDKIEKPTSFYKMLDKVYALLNEMENAYTSLPLPEPAEKLTEDELKMLKAYRAIPNGDG